MPAILGSAQTLANSPPRGGTYGTPEPAATKPGASARAPTPPRAPPPTDASAGATVATLDAVLGTPGGDAIFASLPHARDVLALGATCSAARDAAHADGLRRLALLGAAPSDALLPDEVVGALRAAGVEHGSTLRELSPPIPPRAGLLFASLCDTPSVALAGCDLTAAARAHEPGRASVHAREFVRLPKELVMLRALQPGAIADLPARHLLRATTELLRATLPNDRSLARARPFERNPRVNGGPFTVESISEDFVDGLGEKLPRGFVPHAQALLRALLFRPTHAHVLVRAGDDGAARAAWAAVDFLSDCKQFASEPTDRIWSALDVFEPQTVSDARLAASRIGTFELCAALLQHRAYALCQLARALRHALRCACAAARFRALGRARFGGADFAGAAEAYALALHFTPADTTLLCNRAICANRLGAHRAAADAADAALRADAGNLKAAHALSIALNGLGYVPPGIEVEGVLGRLERASARLGEPVPKAVRDALDSCLRTVAEVPRRAALAAAEAAALRGAARGEPSAALDVCATVRDRLARDGPSKAERKKKPGFGAVVRADADAHAYERADARALAAALGHGAARFGLCRWALLKLAADCDGPDSLGVAHAHATSAMLQGQPPGTGWDRVLANVSSQAFALASQQVMDAGGGGRATTDAAAVDLPGAQAHAQAIYLRAVGWLCASDREPDVDIDASKARPPPAVGSRRTPLPPPVPGTSAGEARELIHTAVTANMLCGQRVCRTPMHCWWELLEESALDHQTELLEMMHIAESTVLSSGDPEADLRCRPF